ncbi:hypothetical protein EDC05_005759 [Coemansia umbellata]|uniref:Sec1-like protein n=1 Tax=Coemansia umbellata TaxID=1424467 RepID=A0ABQ8PEN6_9FUNG|nr:hypothetical protein EDC05_005759 [Coemansia umbellata]
METKYSQDSLTEHTCAVLKEKLAANSKGLETTIYADSVALQTINAIFRDGVLGLLELQSVDGGQPRARSVKSLEQYYYNRDASTDTENCLGCLPESSHAMFLVGSASWPSSKGKVWPAIVHILSTHAFESCTLCVSTEEALWADMAAVFPLDKNYFNAQALTIGTISTALVGLLATGSSRNRSELNTDVVKILTIPQLAAMPLTRNIFILPDAKASADGSSNVNNGHGRQSGDSAQNDEETRQQLERVSLNVISLLRSLHLDGKFYSFGDSSRRVARRCAGILRSISNSSNTEKAVVVILDRALDLVSPTHHNNRLLDQLYRGLHRPCESAFDDNSNDRIVAIASEEQGVDGALADTTLLPGQSLISLLRSYNSEEIGVPSSSFGSFDTFDLWETLMAQEKPVAMQLLRRKMLDSLKETSSDYADSLSSMQGKATVDQLQELVNALKLVDSATHASAQYDALVDIAQAVVDVEAVGAKERWAEIEGAEKTLKLIIGGIKDTLQESLESSRSDEYEGSNSADDILETEMSAAWDQVLAGIPKLTVSMVERCDVGIKSAAESFEKQVSTWLWQHTPAPAMILMAASLLAPARCGIPSSQRMLAEQRLASDYMAVCRTIIDSPNLHEQRQYDRKGQEELAGEWANWIMEKVEQVVISHGQRSKSAQWRDLVSLSHGLDGIYMPLFERIVCDVLNGGRCADLEHAEQGTAVVAAANLLKGLGRRFLSNSKSAGGSVSDDALSTSMSRQQQHGSGGHSAGEAATRCNTVVFFIVGGVTFEEAAAVTAAAHQFGGGRKVLFGSTGICSTATIFSSL